ncbi:hypothetical protein NCAS_0B01300 [Naumovozyma castellii]|uniref:Altered inheritance of mitochondria protein 41 n=1 Tax=Naumovozyma castellii TaxID=27288 RepID=G0VB90_NAUCA|nr:hypothetical protein NCAS_0B01300 [Naumovozyma castellii CBS 4309]CCC68214.1 hypothetical protein NCAS_0B01300 [Naumovozyma castellii CBS 4309]
MFQFTRPLIKTSILPLRLLRFSSTEAYTNALTHLKKDLKAAMLAKDDTKKTTIRSMLSTIKNNEIAQNGKEATFSEFTLFDTYSKMIKESQESIKEFQENDRKDLMEKESAEMEIVKSYLRQLPVTSEEEVDVKVFELLKSLKENDKDLQIKNVFGKVNWRDLSNEWKTSPTVIKRSILRQFKDAL